MAETSKPRRSVLYMPGSNRRALEKARSLDVDGVIMDLEDAVAPGAKAEARDNVLDAIRAGGYGHREIVIRLNDFYTPWGEDDLRAAATSGADAILLPKVDDAAFLNKIGDLLTINGAPPSLKLWVMAETPRAIQNIDRIADGDSRLEVIVMGTSDLGRALRVPDTPGRLGLLPALSACVLAARAHGLDILDGVHGDLADETGFRNACNQGKTLGFDGKTLIHPGQIDAANQIFGVSEAEAEKAAAIIAAWEAAAAEGNGIAVVDGRMIENLHAEEAKRLLALRAAIAARK